MITIQVFQVADIHIYRWAQMYILIKQIPLVAFDISLLLPRSASVLLKHIKKTMIKFSIYMYVYIYIYIDI